MTLAPLSPAAAQEYYSNYNVPGVYCEFDSSSASGLYLCHGQPPVVPPRFVAIAISNSTMATGSAWGYASRDEAEQRALLECSKFAKDCEVADWAYNQCLALAVSQDGSWGVDRAMYVDIAAAKALKLCNDVSENCVVQLHPCSND